MSVSLNVKALAVFAAVSPPHCVFFFLSSASFRPQGEDEFYSDGRLGFFTPANSDIPSQQDLCCQDT